MPSIISLMFHDVTDRGEAERTGFPGPGPALYKLEPNAFRRHLARVASLPRAAVVTVDQLPTILPPAIPVLLTFDDGGVSAFTQIMGRLGDHGWRGHFLVTTDRVGRPGFLDADQIRALHRAGHSVGSHSSSHPPRMARLGWQALRDEWHTSIDCLARIVGGPVRVASVPNGSYTRRVAAAAAAAGIRFLFTSEPTCRPHRVGSCLVLGRYAVRHNTPSGHTASLVTGGTARYVQWAGWNSRKVLRGLTGPLYDHARAALADLR